MKIKTFAYIFFILLLYSSAYSQNYPLSRNDSALVTEYKNAYEKYTNNNNRKEASRYLNKLAMLYWDKKYFNKAENYYLQSLELNKQLGNENGITMISSNLAMIYSDNKKYNKSLEYFEKTLLARRISKNKPSIVSALVNKAVVQNELKKFNDAVKSLKEAFQISKDINDLHQSKACCAMLAETYEKLGDTKKSSLYYGQYNFYNNIIVREERKKTNAELSNERLEKEKALISEKLKQFELTQTESELSETKETLSKKEMNLKLIKQESKINELENTNLKSEAKLQQKILLIISISLIFILIFSVFLFRLYKQKNKMNTLLEKSNDEISAKSEQLEESNKVIADKNKHITQSINYAKHIQSAMLERANQLSNYLPKSFINFFPRDIVSGDFYWYSKIGSKIFVIVSDCTGHGVPGAFISMIGNNILNDVIERKKITDPADILVELDKGVVDSLNQKHSNNTDGMDIAVCVIDEKEKKLHYAGAKSSIIIFQNNELKLVKPDRRTIGGMHVMKRKKVKAGFTTRTFELEGIETTVYLYSDGIVDQFDTLNRNKFTTKRLKSTLEDIQELDMRGQQRKLESVFVDWKGVNKQLDDVTIVGFKTNY